MQQVLRLAGRRLISLPIMLLGVAALVFVVLEPTKNGAARRTLGLSASPEAVAAFNETNGLNDPMPVRYLRFIGNLLQGDLGLTAAPANPVIDRVATALPLTLQLSVLGLLGAMVIALIMGLAGALGRDRWPDHVTRVLSIAGLAIPAFWLAILLIQQFVLRWEIFEVNTYVNPADSVGGWLKSLTLPAVAIAVPVGAQLSRLVRTSVVEELDRDYVRTATGNGLPRWLVIRGVLRNAMITPLTVLGLRFGYALSGAVVIEAIFGLPGMGILLLGAVTSGDVQLVQGAVLTVAVTFLLVNLVVDLLYLVVNPRIRGV